MNEWTAYEAHCFNVQTVNGATSKHPPLLEAGRISSCTVSLMVRSNCEWKAEFPFPESNIQGKRPLKSEFLLVKSGEPHRPRLQSTRLWRGKDRVQFCVTFRVAIKRSPWHFRLENRKFRPPTTTGTHHYCICRAGFPQHQVWRRHTTICLNYCSSATPASGRPVCSSGFRKMPLIPRLSPQ